MLNSFAEVQIHGVNSVVIQFEVNKAHILGSAEGEAVLALNHN